MIVLLSIAVISVAIMTWQETMRKREQYYKWSRAVDELRQLQEQQHAAIARGRPPPMVMKHIPPPAPASRNEDQNSSGVDDGRNSLTRRKTVESFYGDRVHPRWNRTFCIVTGAEGTGSTWITKMMPADHRAPFNPRDGITNTVHRMWSSLITKRVQGAQQALVADLIRFVPKNAQLSVMHVSAPDFDAHHYPDIHSQLWHDFYKAKLNLAIIVMMRNPAEAAHSNHRRGWRHLRVPDGRQDVAHSARSTEMHMTLLSAQVQALAYPADVLVVSYHKVLQNPEQQARRIGKYLHMRPGAEQTFVDRLKSSRRKPSNYSQRLAPHEVKFLESFFESDRARKWQFLWDRASV